jgi:hypothetical protein
MAWSGKTLPHSQNQNGNLPAARSNSIGLSELSFAGAVMCERKQADHDSNSPFMGAWDAEGLFS